MKLQWYDRLYTSESMEKYKNRTISRIHHRKLVPGVYLLTLPANGNNVLDIIPAWVLVQKNYCGRCPQIIGMAKGEDEAYGLAEKILMETYESTGAFRVEEYLKDR